MSHSDAVSDKPKSVWTSLEVAKLTVAALVPISIAATGGYLTQQEKQKEAVHSHWEAIDQVSRSALLRRVRSELLASAIKRHAESPTEHSLQEVLQRKQAYDEAYVDWNANIGRHMLTLRRATGHEAYTELEQLQQRSLVGTVLAPMDACLTQSFDAVVRQKLSVAEETLKQCNLKQLLQQALDCTYEITDRAYVIAARSGTASSAASLGRCPSPS